MHSAPLTAQLPDSADALQSAWRCVLAAAAWSRRAAAPAAELAVAFAVDAAGAPEAVGDDDGRAWVTWRAEQGWTTAPTAPAEVSALLDLYLPLCGASVTRPFTIAHLGQSLDGCIATGSGDSYYVTGPDNVRHLHRVRALCDAVIVGAGTVERDDPQLTVRHVDGANPVRVVLDPRRRLVDSHRVFMSRDPRTLVICGEDARGAATHGWAEVIAVPVEGDRLRLDVLLERLHARGLVSIFIEGGGLTVSRFIEAGLVDRLHVAIAPLVTGSGRPGLSLPAQDKIADCLRPQHRVFAMGGDVLYDCDLRAAADTPSAATGSLTRVL